MTAIETTKERWFEAEANRLAGEFSLKSPEQDAAKAQAYFERALSIARQQQAKSWELRAAMSMARLWRDQGKRDEARELLAPVYGWFTEGFDTLDLKEAKALLDELAAWSAHSSGTSASSVAHPLVTWTKRRVVALRIPPSYVISGESLSAQMVIKKVS